MIKDRNTIKERLDDLSVTDVYSMILFALYKLKDVPEYSTLSELIYLIDKENLLKLLECYGGLTIRIPSIEELNVVLDALLVYEMVQLEHKDINEVFKDINSSVSAKELRETYSKLCDILKDYNFKRS